MEILVTGGAGFIGTHLCRSLVVQGHHIRVLDLVEPREKVGGVKYIRGDIRSSSVMKTAIKGVSVVYHFAAIVSVPVCQEQPVLAYETNLLGTCVVLEAVSNEMKSQGKTIRFVFAGSSVVYGHLGASSEPMIESKISNAPLSFYGAQKLGSEQLIRIFYQKEKIPSVVFRFFNVFGPGQDPSSPYSGVITIFKTAIAAQKPIQLNDSGKPTRDFVHVKDLVRACVSALTLGEEKCDGEAINLGSGKKLSIKDLAILMGEVLATGKKMELINAPAREGDVLHSLADISRAKNLLGWVPEISTKEGLESWV